MRSSTVFASFPDYLLRSGLSLARIGVTIDQARSEAWCCDSQMWRTNEEDSVHIRIRPMILPYQLRKLWIINMIQIRMGLYPRQINLL